MSLAMYLMGIEMMATKRLSSILAMIVWRRRLGFLSLMPPVPYLTSGYKQYQYWLQKALENLPLPHVTLFLDATPVCCYNRIHQRGRVSIHVQYIARHL